MVSDALGPYEQLTLYDGYDDDDLVIIVTVCYLVVDNKKPSTKKTAETYAQTADLVNLIGAKCQ